MANYITLRIRTSTKTSERYFLHGEHECDTYDFLRNHENKQEIDSNSLIHFEWFEITLTSEDVKELKTQCWFKNCSWDNPQLETELKEGATLECVLFY